MTVTVLNKPLCGTIAAPSSKSDLHRKLICASLSDSPCSIAYHGELGHDILATIDCLRALGAQFTIHNSQFTIEIKPIINKLDLPKNSILDCNESGSTLRFLLPVAAALCDDFTVIGSGRLPERPIGTALEILRSHGCIVDGSRLPLRVRDKLSGGKFTLPGDVSSQYLSGLLFALPLIRGGEIALSTALQSAAYVDMTLRTLRDFGVRYSVNNNVYTLCGCPSLTPPASLLTAESDWSNAAFLLCAGAHKDASVMVKGLSQNSLQGDRAIVDILQRMGVNIMKKADSITISGGDLRGITLDVSEIPDLVPPVAVLMSIAQGESRITNASRLRLKESDRLAAMAQSINVIGGNVHEMPDGLIIRGVKTLKGGTADSFNDHRIAMSLALAAAWCRQPVTITNAEAVDKSYPDFFDIYTSCV